MTLESEQPAHRPCRPWPGARASFPLRNFKAQTVITVCAVLVLGVGEGWGQPLVDWQHTYGGHHRDQCIAMIPTRTGGYALAGELTPSINHPPVAYLVLVDSLGQIAYERGYRDDHFGWFSAITECHDGGLLITGAYLDSALVVRTDSTGVVIWERTYPSGGGVFYGILSLENGDFLLTGYCNRQGFSGGGWLMRIDDNGQVIWQQIIRSLGYMTFGSAINLHDGNIVTGGRVTPDSGRGWEGFVYKLTTEGDSIWARTYGTMDDDCLGNLVELPDGRIVAAGMTGIYRPEWRIDFYLVCLSNTGELLWSRTYGQNHIQKCNSLILSSLDGGFILVGYDARNGSQQGCWVVRTDSTGEELWNQHFGEISDCGFSSVVETPNHSYVIAGTIESLDSNDVYLTDFYLVKTTPDPLCINTVLLDPAFPFPFSIFPCYPNPFNSSTRIAYTLATPSDVQLRVYDLMGWEVATLFQGRQMAGSHQALWDGRNALGAPVSSGVYFVRLETPGGGKANRVVMSR